MTEAVYFESPAAFRAWLAKHGKSERELLVGLYKTGTGRPSMTWPESVDEALCHGWIDGVRRRVDDERYTIRFTPRKPTSKWSAVNEKRAKELIDAGRMKRAGRAAFEARAASDYSYERRHEATLAAAAQRQFQAQTKAWAYFQAQPAGYRTTAIHWVTSAKREDTRARRLSTLIEDSAAGRRLKFLAR